MTHSVQPSPEAVQAALIAAHGPGVVTSGIVVWCNYVGVTTADVARTLQDLGFATRECPMTSTDIARVEGWIVPMPPSDAGYVLTQDDVDALGLSTYGNADGEPWRSTDLTATQRAALLALTTNGNPS